MTDKNMNRVLDNLGAAAAGVCWAIVSATPALADDTELFRVSTGPDVRPNVLFIIDESRSMEGTVETQPPYDGATTYPSTGCDGARVYWKAGTGAPPRCSDNEQWFESSALRCDRAMQAFSPAGTGRYWDDHVAQYDPLGGTPPTGHWRDLAQDQKTRVVECEDDRGEHGDGGSAPYAADGLTPDAWSTNSGAEINWDSRDEATLYSANYINWYYGPTGPQTRLRVVQGAVDAVLRDIEGINAGLMRFNGSGGSPGGSQGGYVAVAVAPIEDVRSTLRSAVAGLLPETSTPLAETLYEARQYFAGDAISFGTSSVAAARQSGDTGFYDSPVDEACQQNFVVYLTDGEPTSDNDQDAAIEAMTDAEGSTFRELTGNDVCDADPGIDGTPGAELSCLDDLAHFLYEGDISSTFDDTQRVRTITLGFNVDLPVLEQAAERGNGRPAGDSEGVYFTANDTSSLASVFSEIVSRIQETSASFTSPTVSVNAFNRAENLSDLFVSLFRPSPDYHWPGNLKKYRLRDDGVIVDANNRPAVDPATGAFAEGAQSYWSATSDGADVDLGGAASVIPAARTVFTNLSDAQLNATGNRISKANPAITDAVLGSGAPRATRDEVIDFINGLNPVTGEPRREMGDALHSQPVSVVYGPGSRDGLLFVATNDGFLHALDAATGVEQWAFIPTDFIDHQIDLLENDPLSGKHYAIDGPMRVHVVDDGDGVIESGESVYLFVGMRRGGNFYYGLDISSRNDPRVLWRLDDTRLPGLGESWSAPVPARVKIGGTEHLVLVIGGGYEADQDNDATSTDATGSAIYIVDAVSGNLLWHTGGTNAFASSGQTMEYSIPGDVKVIDLNGDRLMDRMYAADMGGQVWRFDVTTNPSSAADLVAGGVIAQLGSAGDATPTLAENRRFYYSPDIAFVNTRLDNFIHVGIGSGHREHPLGVVNSDRFFALRDRNVRNLSQSQFDALLPIKEGDLVPVTAVDTTIPATQKGWYLDLLPGEKVLAEARTIANQVFFSTFRPATVIGSCRPQPGFTRLYRMSVYNGAPVANLDGPADGTPLSMADLFVESTGAIPSTSQIVFLARDSDNDGIPDDEDPDDDNDGILDGSDIDSDNDGIPDDIDADDDNDGILDVDETAGAEGLVCTDRICVPFGFTNSPVRTYWRQESLD